MYKKYNNLLFLIIIGVLPFFILGGCNGGGGGGCPVTNVSIEVCDPETGGPFTTEIDNDFFPVVPGSESVLEGVDDEGAKAQ